jgi:tetratricopeptide (TPR) repeat protein
MRRAALPALLVCIACGMGDVITSPAAAQAAGDALAGFRLARPSDEESARAMLHGMLQQSIERVHATEVTILATGSDSTAAADVQADVVGAARDELVALLDTIVLRTEWGAAELQRLRRQYPESPLFLHYEGELAVRDGRDSDAIIVFDRLLARRPADVALLRSRGASLARLGRTDESVASYARALELQPADGATFRTLIQLHRDAGSLQQLLEQVRRLRRLHPDISALVDYETEILHRIGTATPTPAGAAFAFAAATATAASALPAAAAGRIDSTPAAQAQGGIRSLKLPFAVSGQASITTDLYAAHGIDARRPGSAWRMSLSPGATLPGGIVVGTDVILSSEQSEFRQNINQLGLNPRWSWGGAHVGDFTRDYSDLTVQGMRVRGLGLDANPGRFRLSIQGGRLQRTVSGSIDGPVYRRNMVAASAGAGAEMGTHINVTVVGARDALTFEDALLVRDTMLVDTMHVDLRPSTDTRPQENLTMALDGQLQLFSRALTLGGAVAASLLTRDLLADDFDPAAGDGPSPGGLSKALAGVFRTRLSTSSDYAYQLNGNLAVRGSRLRGGFEHIGSGYSSLGLPYLVNDRRAWHVGGNTRTRDSRVAVQGMLRRQTNNLLSQKLNTVHRDMANVTITTRLTDALSLGVTGLLTTLANDAASDSVRLDTRSYAVNTNASLRNTLLGLPTVYSLAYGVQQTTDGNMLAVIPNVSSHTVSGSVQMTLTPTVSIAPTLSGVITDGEGMERQENLLVGFRGNARFLDGNLRTNTNLNHTVNQGRQVSGFQFRASYPLGWGTDLAFQTRHTRYGEFGDRPAFRESFATTSISRSF